MSETTERNAYDKLSPQRKQLADMLVANLDSGGLWKQGGGHAAHPKLYN